jgi:hypothetical protein
MPSLRLWMAIAALLLPGTLAAQQASPQQQAPAQQKGEQTNMGREQGLGSPGAAHSRRDEPGSSSATTAKPPVAGANSFTEVQARDRIAKAGFQNVKDLKQDREGIWRGKAQKSGSEVTVSLDYRGNVVQQ